MKQEILDSIKRMSKDDCLDVQSTCNLETSKKADIKRIALQNENVAEYVLQY